MEKTGKNQWRTAFESVKVDAIDAIYTLLKYPKNSKIKHFNKWKWKCAVKKLNENAKIPKLSA